MTKCPSCSAVIADQAQRCPSCGSELDLSSLLTETGLSDETGPVSPSDSGASSGASAIGITSEIQGGAGEHPPGTILAGRYRVVGMLGRGGMGTVYRADDLTLGQPVALKFLPDELAGNLDRLDRFRAEVRVARQVSHPNVCRVHDISEANGRIFLSMELVDGGDLSSLLKRVGRMPTDRGLEIARQLCAGLAAAHDRGVLHRDLKPANVMIDSEGRVRIADFGLAGAVGGFADGEIRCGTPAYMAPETLRGSEVTTRSDLYALGLVLYELFTGKRAFSGASMAELERKQLEETPTTPSEIVADLDPQIERVILQCLSKEPGARPSTALAVAMALPGGDPLAAALAAGETPSPDLVAQAGGEGTLAPIHGWTLVGVSVLCLALFLGLASKRQLIRYESLERPPAVQLDRGIEALERLGVDIPEADRKSGFLIDRPVLRELNRDGVDDSEIDGLASGGVSAIRFWLRAAPSALVAERTSGRVGPARPPRSMPGELYARFDGRGRLRYFELVPDALVDTDDEPPNDSVEIAWSRALEAAGVDALEYRSADPLWSPPQDVDELRAWTRSVPKAELGVHRLEAGVRSGRIAYLRTGTTLDENDDGPAGNQGTTLGQTINALLIVIVLVVGALVARRNLRRGRVDLRGSWRMTGAILTLGLASWLVSANHALGAGSELNLFVLASGGALFMAAFVWLLYVALEPEIRRHWPERLISWQRLLSGGWRDPLVGRHVLVGLALGNGLNMMLALITTIGARFSPVAFRLESAGINLLAGTGLTVAHVLSHLVQAIFAGVFITVLILLLRLLLRRTWAAVAVSVVIFVAMNVLGSDNPVWNGAISFVILCAVMISLLRYGLLTLITAILVLNLLQTISPTTTWSAWYATPTVISVIAIVALTAWALWASVERGEPSGSP